MAALGLGVVLALTAYNYSVSAPIRFARVPDKAHRRGKTQGEDGARSNLIVHVKRLLRGLEGMSKIMCGWFIIGTIRACSSLVASTTAATWSPGLLAFLAFLVCQFGGPPAIVAGIVYFGAKAKAAKVGLIAAQVAAANLSASGALMCGILSVFFQLLVAN